MLSKRQPELESMKMEQSKKYLQESISKICFLLSIVQKTFINDIGRACFKSISFIATLQEKLHLQELKISLQLSLAKV